MDDPYPIMFAMYVNNIIESHNRSIYMSAELGKRSLHLMCHACSYPRYNFCIPVCDPQAIRMNCN